MLTLNRFAQISVTAILIGCSREPQPSAAQNLPPGSSGVVVPTNDQVSQSRQNAITTAVARTAPAVVTVQTEAVDQSPRDPFEMFFGGGQRPRTQAGLGTGFIVRKGRRDRHQRARHRERHEDLRDDA
jgi:S1-C subfamily serine protease